MLQNKKSRQIGDRDYFGNMFGDTSRPTLTSSQIRELKAAFSMLDKNKDGRVNETEIKCMLDKLGIVLTDTMVGKLIDQASKRGDRLLNEEEFLAWMSHQSVQDDVMADLMAAFRVFDKDRNGYITRDELRTAMETIGEPMSEEQLDLMIRATDIDNDGRINYEEFVRMLL
ncbi:calcium-binding protein E63-1 [Caerostris darwini]|uniref:Calcium-binding protein E63-1 n=1 Tax=Caerostris darwini TaxID=1538125 RepID=A0AAV4QPV2_9ARAC|nr:calcium-binding protein E63-1 [Caerostris darwini]